VRATPACWSFESLLDRLPRALSGHVSARALAVPGALNRRVSCGRPLSNLDARLRHRCGIELRGAPAAGRHYESYVTPSGRVVSLGQPPWFDRGRIPQIGHARCACTSTANRFVAASWAARENFCQCAWTPMAQ